MAETALARVGNLKLRRGGMLRDAEIAYVSYGRLARDGRNAVLMTHGYTSSHLFVDGGAAASEGSWSALVGPGRAIDTDRYFVVSSNMLGSSFGSTAPRSRNPATGRPYGADFPPITVPDIVAAQRRMLEGLGVRELVAVVGPSYGGFQAFTWGVEQPGFARGLVAAVSGLRRPSDAGLERTRERLAADPNWNGGNYYATGGVVGTMTALREDTLRNYGIEAELAERFPDPGARAAEITRQARAWAEAFDANSMLALGDALTGFDLTPHVGKITARVLYVLSRTDAIFPPVLAEEVMGALKAAGVRAEYFELDSPHGHLASGTDAAKWAPVLRGFMESLG